ncbi:response regulator [Paenibacillus sp. HB172176]|uniref:response regulator transcription factor n=1 Tax=Paenibacillus sp. HB172176 TaxID=2493690 RepID=UPI00143C40A1|nr:response regulator [Paenibacillus sp. HB172176]
MNLMIAEDEMQLRNSIARNIPWHEHDITVAALAANGNEALELFEQVKPEIVLMDIRMPGMDGLTLAPKLLQMQPATKIIILSGYDSFDYAQKAIELGVYHYLLKPAGDKQIVSIVTGAASELRKELEVLQTQEEALKRWQEHLPRLQLMFFQNWIMGRYANWELESKSEELHIRLPANGTYIAAVLDMDPLQSGETRFTERDQSLIRFSLHGIAVELLQDQSLWVFQDAGERAVLLFYGEEGEQEEQLYNRVNIWASKLLEAIKECLKLTASAGVGGAVAQPVNVSQSWLQAVQALNKRILYGNDLVIPHRDQDQARNEVQADNSLIRTMKSAIDVGDEEKALATCRELLEEGLHKMGSAEAVKEQILYLAGVFIRMIHLRGWSVQEVAGSDYERFHRLESLQTKEQVGELFERMVAKIIHYANQTRLSGTQKLIRDIVAYVEREITSDISLHGIAQKFFINASYLSRVFKKEMGISFSVYIFDKKMEYARRNLSEGMKVYDVANLLGYADISYFIRVFHKHWGVTPGEIKKG